MWMWHPAASKKRLEAAFTLPAVRGEPTSAIAEPSSGGDKAVGNIDFSFFDPSQPIEHLSGNLPHWRQEGVQYLVTFRLADSIPQCKLQQWQSE
jgi:hypothetical protein